MDTIPGDKDRTRPREGGSRTVDKDGNEIKPVTKPVAKPKKPKETPPTANEGE